jgi:hypothetical protein
MVQLTLELTVLPLNIKLQYIIFKPLYHEA